MSPRRKLMLAAAACGACCAIPLLLVPVLAALGLSGAGAAVAVWAGWIEAGLAALLAAIGGVLIFLGLRRRRAARSLCMVPAAENGPSGRNASSA